MSLAERYRIIDRLDAGGLGVVHLAQDLACGETVALKVMPRTTGAANLRSEFLALARLRHPNIVEVRDYGLTEAGQDYFTMEYVAGPPLLEAVSEVPSPTFYQLVGGVLRALAMVHSRGLVHADIKPSNILVDGELLVRDPIAAARLCDFGLAAAVDDPAAGDARGTFPYAAPEVYAGRLDARSDLYSLGVVLYELCCGVQPYTGPTPKDVLSAQLQGPPIAPDQRSDKLPAGLSELILAMLDPAPSARPQTADEILARINTIAGTQFDIANSRPLVDMSGIFVGRERDLDALREQWKGTAESRGSVVLVAGEEGIGKSRLLGELELEVKLAGGRTLKVSAAGSESQPLRAVAELVRALLAKLGGRPVDRALRRTLAPLLGGRGSAPRLDASSRYALAEAVTTILLQAAAVEPLLVIVDDMQLADSATAELIAYLARSVAESPVMLAIGGRDAADDELGHSQDPVSLADHAIRAAVRGQRFDLPPLDRASIRRLARRAFGDEVADALGHELHRATGGNPAYAAAALAALVEQGSIARERGSWLLRDANTAVPLARDAIAAAITRADHLDIESRALLETASALGTSFTRDELEVLMTDSKLINRALGEFAAARLIDADAGAGSFRFIHPELATALYGRLGESRRQTLHRAAADYLRARRSAGHPVAAAALARHLFALADPEAPAVGLEAADERAASYDHHGALAWCERVRPKVADPALAARVDERLGQLRALLGDVQGACVAYRAALHAREGNPAEHIRMALELGELERRLGQGERALAVLMTALDEARAHKLSLEEARCQLRIGWVLMYRADYKAATEHAVAGHMVARAAGHATVSAELGRLRGTIDLYRGDTRSALEQLATALSDAETAGDASQTANVLHTTGHAALRAGDYPRAIDALEKAIEVSEAAGNIEQSAKSLNNLGAACYYQGDWQRARSSWDRFRRLCERLDERTELVRALSNLGSLYRELGQFSQARESLIRAKEIAALTGHAHAAAMVTANLGEVMFREGDIAGARERYALAASEFERIGAREDIIETKRRVCELDVAAGKLNEAMERSVDTAREAKEAGAILEEGILHRVAASALRLSGDLESAEWFNTRAREILTGLGSRYELAKVDLESAEVAAAAGKKGEAAPLLAAATKAFAELGARWDLSVCRARKRAIFTDSPSRPSLIGRPGVGLDLLLELTEALGSLDLERLLEVALDKLLELSKFERGFILLLDHEGRPSERLRRIREGSRSFDKSEAEFSGTIVRRVAASGEAASVSDIADDADLREQRSVVSLGLRQVMCAPMRSRGRVIGIVYIDSRRLAFDGHGVDLPFLEAFSAQLALATENARLLVEEKRQAELLAILAHEIRNPLAGIIGYADIGEADGFGDEPTELFGHIRQDANRLKRLVDNVLELSRHESGNVEWSMMSFDIDELVCDVVRAYTPACEQQGIALVAEPGELDRRPLGNPDRIMQVLSNLVGNAVKFTPQGGTITVRARLESVANSDPQAPPIPATDIDAWTPAMPSDKTRQTFVRVDVIDDGPGMSEDVRARLFQKFAQGASRQRTMGVGLGLYISRNIVLRHGGSIFVDSTLGEGSTFSMRLPVAGP